MTPDEALGTLRRHLTSPLGDTLRHAGTLDRAAVDDVGAALVALAPILGARHVENDVLVAVFAYVVTIAHRRDRSPAVDAFLAAYTASVEVALLGYGADEVRKTWSLHFKT